MRTTPAFTFPRASWRLINDEAYPVQMGLAIDEVLFDEMDRPEYQGPNIIRFYQFSPPSIVVGFHQDIKEINLQYIRETGLELGRRITGGGAIIMGVPDVDSQLGISILVKNPSGFPVKLGSKYALLSLALVTGLKQLGLEVQYQPNSDITLIGKKITGQALLSTDNMTFLHSTITIDYDLETMLRVMKIEPDDATMERFKEKFTTIKEHCPLITMKALKQAINAGFDLEYNTILEEIALGEDELTSAQKLVDEKHSTAAYLYNIEGATFGSCFL
ncbi:MAG TPA: hypothetical protein VKM55_28655 [Candidatus Lokiarchaeia archaeon]|nr:hypothetical protein [Candidatus Lokiarchaeia archaeon]